MTKPAWRHLRFKLLHTAAVLLAVAPSLWSQAAAPPAQVPTVPQLPASSPQAPPSMLVTLEQAIEFARKNNAVLQANRTLISQNKEQEVTANLRPNPVLTWDTQYLPLFTPGLWSSDYINNTAQFDAGVGYLFERGKKRQHRLQAAKDAMAVTEAQVFDAERTTIGNAAQQFVAALLAKANLEFAEQLLLSYQQTIRISREQFQAGGMSRVDLLKIQLQNLQLQSDVSAARIAKVQALADLRQLMGYDSVPRDYDVSGELTFTPVALRLESLQVRALKERPDLLAARRGIMAVESQIGLAKANATQDLSATFDYTHLNASNLAAFYFSIPLPIFNRNQGEVARNYFALTQSQFQEKAAEQQVLTDVTNAYESLQTAQEVVQLYQQGYLQQAQQALQITEFSFRHGAASLLDFLDAERSYRSTELNYRQALASYMGSLEALRLAVGSRNLP